MVQNPILKGFNPDPAICRRGDDYYIAVSSFEWFPAIPVYHSRDLSHWTLHTHVINDRHLLDLRKLRSAKGIWAPCLTWSEAEGLFYVLYGVMNSMNGRYFDVDNYLVSAENIEGPWSEPVYLHSAGYDASLVHDDDGRKWVVAVDWETRDNYQGAISVVEYNAESRSLIGYPQRIWSGAFEIGAEGAHITKRNGYYYLMCAEGGTGYGHCVTMGRARNIFGPYEKDPLNPILTSATAAALHAPLIINKDSAEAFDKDYLRRACFNPDSYLQKSGHASYVENDNGEVLLVHLCARPLRPELCCPLGRETAIQRMYWSEDNWLRLSSGGNLAQEGMETGAVGGSQGAGVVEHHIQFDSAALDINLYAPRIAADCFADTATKAGYVTLRGQESLCSENNVSLLARKLTSLDTTVSSKMDFSPQVFQHSAGLVLYYDNMNYLFLQKTFDEQTASPSLYVIHLDNGLKREDHLDEIHPEQAELYLRLNIAGRKTFFSWSVDGEQYQRIGKEYATALFSDEYSRYGEFTGCFVGMACVDSLYHRAAAHFAFLHYRADESKKIS
ncbi:glycoside hydrolase family 43 protein [Pantoea sp. B65]